MNNLYNKIYEAVDKGITKALIIDNDQSQDISVGWHKKEISNEFVSYETMKVDLGLPSGLLWCKYNLGAKPGDTPEDWYGDYYAWGETYTKSSYMRNNYRFYDNLKKQITFQYGNNISRLETKDDAASTNLCDLYRMPSMDDWTELLDNTTMEHVKNYNNVKGLNGTLFTSKNNGKQLFFPAAGYYNGNQRYSVGNYCNLWTSTIGTTIQSYTYYIQLSTNYNQFSETFCYHGLSVRGVYDPN